MAYTLTQPSGLPSGVKVTFGRNILYCSIERDAEHNLNLILGALSLIEDKEITSNFILEEGGRIEFYREH